MQNSFESKFSAMIRKRNAKSYTDKIARFKFLSLFIIGFISGCLVFSGFSNKALSPYYTYISKHLQDIISMRGEFSLLLFEVIKISKTDLYHLFFVFIAGFTYFCFPVTGDIVFTKGFMFGYSLFFIKHLPNDIVLNSKVAFTVIFFMIKLIIGIITASQAAETYIFSYDFKLIKQNCSILRRSPATYKFAFLFLKSLGGCLLLNLIYCILIKLLI